MTEQSADAPSGATTSWTDSTGREWAAKIDLGAARRFVDEKGIDLLNAEQLGQAMQDPWRVLDLLVLAHRTQAQARQLSDGDLVELATETEEIAQASFESTGEALAAFFGRLRRQSLALVVRKAMAVSRTQEQKTTHTLETRADEILEHTISQAEEEMNRKLDQFLQGSSGQMSTSTRRSAA
jgi:hypothetical protein